LFVPTTFAVTDESGRSKTSFILGEVKYLGGDDSLGEGTLLGIAYPVRNPQPVSAPVLKSTDTNSTLEDIAKRALANQDALGIVLVMKLRITWSTWKLRLSVQNGDSLVKRKSGAPRLPDYVEKSLKNAKNPVSLLELDTAHVDLPVGEERVFKAKACGRFSRAGITVQVYSEDDPVTAPSFEPIDFSQAPPNSNSMMKMPFGLMNLIFTRAYTDSVPIGSGTASSLKLSDLQIGPSNNGIFLSATAAGTPSESRFRIQTNLNGNDLAFDTFELTETTCGKLSTNDCLGQKALFRIVVGALNNSWHGRLLRPLNVKTYRINLGGEKRVGFLVNFRKLTATNDSVVAYNEIWLSGK